MKVLSLTEPYATLLMNNIKNVETRSWKTAYRGELYIHTSSTKVTKESKSNKELMQLACKYNYNFGYITCKCTLVGCILMTKEYVENMKKIITMNIFVEYMKKEDMPGY